jgi:hypothetical protein
MTSAVSPILVGPLYPNDRPSTQRLGGGLTPYAPLAMERDAYCDTFATFDSCESRGQEEVCPTYEESLQLDPKNQNGKRHLMAVWTN